MKISGYVSVLLPVHNGALVVRSCLEAIARQTYRPLEIVLVDDGSSDASPAWVRSFRAAHPEEPVHVVSQPRAGTGAALNAALARARGEFIAPCHQGDVWTEDKLARQIAQLQAAPEAAFSLGAVEEQVGPSRLRLAAPRPGRGLLYQPVSLSSLVARREAVTRAGGFDDCPGIAAAHDLVCRLVQTHTGKRLDAVLATCHRRARAPLPVGELTATLEKLSREGRLSPRQLRWGQCRLHTREGWRALLADEPGRAKESFRQAIAANAWRADTWLGLVFAHADERLFASGLLGAHTPRTGG